jgi:glycosyltransferase involved in cell wall biosynthesis
MQKHSILFLCKLYHPHIGGVEKHVEEITHELIRKGFAITIVTEQYDKNLPLIEKVGGVSIIRIPIGQSVFLKKFYIWKWMLLHLSVLISHDIIHIHDVFYWILPFRLVIFYKKVYITFHGYEGFPIKLKWKIQRKIAEILTKGNICVGDFMKKWYKTTPSVVIYGGVRLEGKNVKPDPQSAVFFGRLDAQTGIDEYVNAYKHLKTKFPKFRFTVVGEGEYRDKIPQDVHVEPFQKDVGRYISENRFIFVSRYLSMLEALALKREVIAVYDNPVKRDYLLMSPFKQYVSIAKNSNDIEEFIVSALKSDQSAETIKKGYEWARAQTWEKIARHYVDLWRVL